MSTVAARRCLQVLDNARRVVAIELLTAAQALAHRLEENPNHRLGKGNKEGFSTVHNLLFELEADHTISEQIETIAKAIQAGLFDQEGTQP